MKIKIKERKAEKSTNKVDAVRDQEQEPTENYHKLTLSELAAQFSTSITNGLDENQAAKLLIEHGPNRIKQKKPNQFVKYFMYFFSGFGALFSAAAVLCILAWQPIGALNGETPQILNLALGVMLILVVIIQGFFNAFQDWSSQKVMNSIKNMMPSNAYVIRGGKEVAIPSEEVVPGDILKLLYGQKVSADCRIIETKDLKFDKSMLTGESEAIEGTVEATDEKYVESKNMAYMTTLITQGQGKGLVIATGDKTMMGKIAGLTGQTVEKKTNLQKEIQRFINIICVGAAISAIVVIVTWAAWLRVSYPAYIDYVSLMINTISVVIGFIPDGLPVSVTLSLLIIAIRMKRSRVLAKNLTVIETLSCVNVIASDKTGTLTQNKMFVASASAGLDEVNLDEIASGNYERSVAFNQLVSTSGLCNNAQFADEANDKVKNIPITKREAKGDATDVALLRFWAEYDTSKDELEKAYDVRAEIPFNSQNKWMVKVIKPMNPTVHDQLFGADNDMNSDIILLKGAPDYLLKKSTHYIMHDGRMSPIKPAVINKVVEIQNNWCLLGQRVLMICKKKCNLNSIFETDSSVGELEKYIHKSEDFCIIGLVGIIDPPREGISEVIATCRKAGIRVLMVTGDYALTAAAIAAQIGILTQPQYDTAESMRVKHKEGGSGGEKKSLLLTGNDLDTMDENDWRIITQYDEIVLARTTPEQKLRTVKEFQADEYIVGVTGDGVNDAPALKSANIGIAMGSGSEVAMEASQLVLLDSNFSSILVAIENGRLVFENLRKVILYLLPAGSMGELVPVLMSIFIGVQCNLSAFAMILIALFTDMAPSMALMKEQPEIDLLALKPRTKKDHLTDWRFIIQAYCFMGVMVVFFSQTMFFIYMKMALNMDAGQILLAFDKLASNYNDSNWLTLKDMPNYNYTSSTDLNNYFNTQFYTAQTVTFTSLVMLQIFGNLISTRTHKKSFFQQPPWKRGKLNLWIFAAQCCSLCIMVIVVYVPAFQYLFQTGPVPAQFIFMPLCFCLVIFTLDELRKLAVRRNFLCFGKIGW